MSERVDGLVDALVAAGADEPFYHEGLTYFLTPLWVVRAYAAARLAREGAEAIAGACLAAHFGREAVAEFAANPKCVGLQIGRAWLARCGDLERKARGLPGGGRLEVAA
jgi:hypothetical protein